jgi:uncharacterized membrane protein
MRAMDDVMTAIHLENLDRRLARVERILPTLATKADLAEAVAPLATKEELAPLATKEELRAAIAQLATKEELAAQGDDRRREIRDEGERSRRHMGVLIEGQREDIQLLAEHLSIVISKIADR